MKFFNILAAATLALNLASSLALAKGGEIVSAQQIDQDTVELTVRSQFHCNDPLVSFEYMFSNKAIFGPLHYEVEIVGRNRALCEKPELFTVNLPIPQGLQQSVVLSVYGDNNTQTSITIK